MLWGGYIEAGDMERIVNYMDEDHGHGDLSLHQPPGMMCLGPHHAISQSWVWTIYRCIMVYIYYIIWYMIYDIWYIIYYYILLLLLLLWLYYYYIYILYIIYHKNSYYIRRLSSVCVRCRSISPRAETLQRRERCQRIHACAKWILRASPAKKSTRTA